MRGVIFYVHGGAGFDDVFAACRRLVEDQKIPASEIVVAGDSAGGGLTIAPLLHLRELDIYEDIFHGFQMLASLIPESNASLRRAAEFICRHVSLEKNYLI